MSITSSTIKASPIGAKIALVSVMSLGLLGSSVALSAPAEAKTSERGCTVDPLKPKLVEDDHKKKNDRDKKDHKVNFIIKVDCNGNKMVQIKQKRFEDHKNLGNSASTRSSRVMMHPGRSTACMTCPTHGAQKRFTTKSPSG